MTNIFYRPSDGFVGDVIPFYWQGLYHAFYLKAPLPPNRQGANGTPYAHVVSRDLAHWDQWPIVVEPGEPGAPDDLSCFTGSVIERNGIFHLFYTGYRGEGKPQTICRATSRDLRTWEKDPHNPILSADPRWYEPNDWRDPFPFWNEEAGEYWMILAAREKSGPSNRRGCIALVTSPDLKHWEARPPLWSPSLYYTHECPDLFRMGDWWYLVYSTFSERHITHYRMSRSLNGPWHAPTNDSFDGRAFYAAKTASDGQRRFVFGWNPTRDGETDHGRWDWGGNMVVHEINADPITGALTVQVPPGVDTLFPHTQLLAIQPCIGHWKAQDNSVVSARTDGFAASFIADGSACCAIECTIICPSETRSCGILLRIDELLEAYYQIRWEPGNGRVVFDRWPRPGDEPFMLERPLSVPPQSPLKMKIFVDGTVMVAYINDTVALNCRMYDHLTGRFGVFVAEGEAIFSDIVIRTP